MAVILQVEYTGEMVFSTKYKNVCGLYKIEIGDKFYYGSSNNLYNRFYQHVPELRHNKHKNRYLQSAFNKYKDFKFSVICICEPEQRRELEHRLLQKFENNPKCMNLTLRTEGPSGVKWTDEARKKMSEKMKGNTNGRFGKGVKRTMSPEARARQIAGHLKVHNKPVIAITEAGEKITFESIKHAAKALAVPMKTMSNWTRGICKPSSHKGYIGWTFSQGDDSISL